MSTYTPLCARAQRLHTCNQPTYNHTRRFESKWLSTALYKPFGDPVPTTSTEDWSYRTPVAELLSAPWVRWIGVKPAALAVHEAENRAHAQLLATVSVGMVPGHEDEAAADDSEVELPIISKGASAEPLTITQQAIRHRQRESMTFFESLTVTLHPGQCT